MTPRELNGRQLTDLGMEGSAVKTCFSSKQLDYTNLLTDDATFLLGDTCYVSDINAFGIIRELLTVNKRLYADLQLFGPHTFDSECSIPYAPKTPTDRLFLGKLSALSRPLVTAVEDDSIWFVSYVGTPHFAWLSAHLQL